MIRLLPWIVAVWCLFFSAHAQAASFDCAKAKTTIEKLICADAVLSRLDEELAAVYKTALQDEKRAKSLIQVQKQWMKDRNGCVDADCVKLAYVVRLQGFSNNGEPTMHTVGKKTSLNFSGQWHLKLCDKSISEQCGDFTVYLVQTGEKICGDHFFATPGGGRLNEGAPRSIIGSVAESNVANIVITSGRNGAVYRVRATKNDDVLSWEVVEEIKLGPEGDSALVLDKGNLKRELADSNYQSVFSACQSHEYNSYLQGEKP